MLRHAVLTLISLFAITTAVSAQYGPSTNRDLRPGEYFCPQHNTYCTHAQFQYEPPTQQGQRQQNPQSTGTVPPGYHYCQNHNQYCTHAPLNDPRYNGGYNNGQYQGDQYNNGQYNYNNGNRGNRGNRNINNGNLRNQTPPVGHYYCKTHNSFCSH